MRFSLPSLVARWPSHDSVSWVPTPQYTARVEKGLLMVKKGPARLSLAVVRGRESQLAGKGCPTPVIHTSGAADVLRLAPQTREALRASATENSNESLKD